MPEVKLEICNFLQGFFNILVSQICILFSSWSTAHNKYEIYIIGFLLCGYNTGYEKHVLQTLGRPKISLGLNNQLYSGMA